jgi:hypothetical protein
VSRRAPTTASVEHGSSAATLTAAQHETASTLNGQAGRANMLGQGP